MIFSWIAFALSATAFLLQVKMFMDVKEVEEMRRKAEELRRKYVREALEK